MGHTFKSLRQAFQSLFRLRMLSLIFVPPIVSLVAVLVVFIYFWGTWIEWLVGLLSGLRIFDWFQVAVGLHDLSYWIALVFLILAFIPLVFIMALVITSVFVMPVVLLEVEKTDFPKLEKRKGGTLVGSIWNMLVTTVVFLILFTITLPLWLVPGLQVAVPMLLTAWLNKRIFMYDVLQDFATKEERKRILNEHALSLYALGGMLVMMAYIPLAFLFIPVVSALAFSFYGLNALAELRKEEAQRTQSVDPS